MKNLENVKTAVVVFVNHKEFKNHAELYDNETGFSFINEDDLVCCGYEDTTIEKMLEDLKISINTLDDNFQREPYGTGELYTHWELYSGINSSGKKQTVIITFVKGDKPRVEYRNATSADHYINKTIADYIHYSN